MPFDDQYPKLLPPPITSELEEAWPPPGWGVATDTTEVADSLEVPSSESLFDPADFPIAKDLYAAQVAKDQTDWTAAEEAKQRFEAQAEAVNAPPPPAENVVPEATPEPAIAPEVAPAEAAWPPVEWTPDAVSGGYTEAQDDRLPEPEEEPLDPYETLTPAETVDDRYDEYSRMSPEALAKQYAEEDEQKRSYFAGEQETILHEDRIAQRENEARDQLARNNATRQTNELRQDIERLAEQDVDPGRWKDSRSPLQTAAMYLTAMMGGFLAPQNGGKNRGLDMIMRYIDQDIDAQKADLANQRGALDQRQSLIAELKKTNGDSYRADEAARVIRLKQAGQMLAVEAEKYDPDGTAARRAMETMQGLHAAAGEKQAALEQTMFDRTMKISDLDIRRSGELRQQRKTNFDIKKGEWEIKRKSRRGPGRPKDPSLSDKIKAEKNGFVWNGSTFVKDPNFKGQPESRESLDMENIKARTAKVERENSDEERSRQFGSRLKTKGGKEILLGTTAEASAMRNARGQLDTLSGLIDDLSVIRDSEGFSSATLKGKEWQRMSSKFKQMQLEAKDLFELGVLAGEDLNLINGVFATSDPTEVRGMLTGLSEARQGMVNRFNNKLRAAAPVGDEAERYEPPRKSIAKAQEQSADEILSTIGDGLAPHLRLQDPGSAERKAGIEELRAPIAVLSRSKQPSVASMRSAARSIAAQVDAGDITEGEAIEIVSELGPIVAQKEAKRLMKKHKAEVQSMSVEEIKERQEDPTWLEELRDIQWMRKPSSPAFDREIYRYMVK